MRIRNAIIAAGLLLIILAIALVSGSILMLRLFSLGVLVLSLGYLWAYVGIRGITGQVRGLVERCQVGGWLEEETTVSTSSRMPKFLVKAEENTTLPGHHNTAVFSLSPKSSYSWRNRVYCQHRGQYTLGAITVTVNDPFGFFSLKRQLGETQRLIIYPATVELPFFQPTYNFELGSGSSRWLISEIGPNAARVREYANGDTLTRVHWHSTAHTGKLMVKEFDADHSHQAPKNIWIVLDMNRAAQAGQGDDTTEEYGVTIAASLMKKYVDSGLRAGLIASAEQPYFFFPEAGSSHLWRVLEALALMRAAGGVPIGQLISQELEHFGIGSLVIVITAAADERMITALRLARSRGARVMVVLLDAASFGGTAGTANLSARLIPSGCEVYIIRHGEKLARLFGSRAPERAGERVAYRGEG